MRPSNTPRQLPINQDFDAPHTFKETQKAISQLSSRKAPGIDVVPAEGYKSGGPALTQKLVTTKRKCGRVEPPVLFKETRKQGNLTLFSLIRKKNSFQGALLKKGALMRGEGPKKN